MLRELGNELLDEGKGKSDPRHLSMAEAAFGLSNLLAGNFQLAIQNFKTSLGLSKDHLVINTSTLFLGNSYLLNGQYDEALSVLEEVIRVSEKDGIEFLGTMALVV